MKQQEENTLIAVYGTLRKSFGNSGYLGNSKFIDSGWTKEKYKLTASGIPFVKQTEPISTVRVEVYEVTPEQLPMVDRLEGYNPNRHDESWYKRTPIQVNLDNGEEVTASIYFNDDEGRELIESGDYKDYRK